MSVVHLNRFFWQSIRIFIPIDTVAVLGAADHVADSFLFVSLGEIRVHGTYAAQEAVFVVIGPRLDPFGEQLDAAFEQTERTAFLFAQGFHDRR